MQNIVYVNMVVRPVGGSKFTDVVKIRSNSKYEPGVPYIKGRRGDH